MFCRHCGNVLPNEFAVTCKNCGCEPCTGNAFCPNCGVRVNEQQDTCPACGCFLGLHLPQTTCARPLCTVDRTTAALFALLLGIGIHHFYMGNARAGILHLLVTIVTCGIIGSLISVIEGYKYLSMSDEEFYYTYILNKKDWF